jgi:hypothetical protein
MKIDDYRPSRITAKGKRVCFWGARESAKLDSGDLSSQLVRSGNNSGNIFIGAGLFRNLDCDEKVYHPGFERLPAENLHEHYDYMFIAASNFVGESVDLTSAYEYLRKSKIKLFCFGLGSQFLPGQDVNLKPGTDRFLRLLSERSGSIGVRGTFTAELLWKLGIRNLSLTGCPSLLGLSADALNRLVNTRPTLQKIAFNESSNVRRHALNPDALRDTENTLFRRMLNENSFYILQNEQAEMAAMAATAAGEDADFESPMATIRYIYDVKDLGKSVDAFIKSRLRMFFDVDDWVGCMSTMTASIGSRFHGRNACACSSS